MISSNIILTLITWFWGYTKHPNVLLDPTLDFIKKKKMVVNGLYCLDLVLVILLFLNLLVEVLWVGFWFLFWRKQKSDRELENQRCDNTLKRCTRGRIVIGMMFWWKEHFRNTIYHKTQGVHSISTRGTRGRNKNWGKFLNSSGV